MQDLQLVLRQATTRDSQILYTWRNDPLTRENSLCSDEVDPAQHLDWLHNSLIQGSRRLYIAEVSSEPVGTVRADRQDNSIYWLISWTVAPKFRGKGIGKLMVQELIKLINDPVEAHIKSTNIASQQIALKSGLLLSSSQDGILIYQSDKNKT